MEIIQVKYYANISVSAVLRHMHQKKMEIFLTRTAMFSKVFGAHVPYHMPLLSRPGVTGQIAYRNWEGIQRVNLMCTLAVPRRTAI